MNKIRKILAKNCIGEQRTHCFYCKQNKGNWGCGYLDKAEQEITELVKSLVPEPAEMIKKYKNMNLSLLKWKLCRDEINSKIEEVLKDDKSNSV